MKRRPNVFAGPARALTPEVIQWFRDYFNSWFSHTHLHIDQPPPNYNVDIELHPWDDPRDTSRLNLNVTVVARWDNGTEVA